MPRAKFQTLTEQMFYILLCLKKECCGMDIMDKITAMTAGRIHVGAGTLYNLLEQFCESGMIQQTKAEGRRKSYILTEKGIEALETEYQRLQWQMADYKRMMDYTEQKEETKKALLHIV